MTFLPNAVQIKYLKDNNFRYDKRLNRWISKDFGFYLSNEALEFNDWELNKELIAYELQKYKDWIDEKINKVLEGTSDIPGEPIGLLNSALGAVPVDKPKKPKANRKDK